MKTQNNTKGYKRVVCTVDATVFDLIEAERRRRGECSLSSVVRSVLNRWAADMSPAVRPVRSVRPDVLAVDTTAHTESAVGRLSAEEAVA